MFEKKYLNWLIPGLVLMVLAGIMFWYQAKQYAGAVNRGWIEAYSGGATMASTTIIGMTKTGAMPSNDGVASSTLVLPANPYAMYRRIANVGTRPLACLPGSTATSTQVLGIVLEPRASSTLYNFYEWNFNNPYSGEVYCYAPNNSGTSTVTVVEN